MKRHAQPLAILVLALVGLTASVTIVAGDSAPPLNLRHRDAESRFRLADQQGKIVVLDFFSASCGDCFRVSRDLQVGIEEYYAVRKGNPHGVPVQVAAVSTEEAERDEMEIFIQETGVSVVLEDNGGLTLARYGGVSVPFVVVIDATGTGAAAPRVVWREAAFQGTAALRQVIDRIAGRAEADDESGSLSVIPDESRITHEVGLDSAWLTASDVLVADSLVEYRQTRPASEFALSLSHRHIDVHYQSDHFGFKRQDDLADERFGIQGEGRFDVGEALELMFGGGAYEGHQSYRSLWLEEYYRHMFDVLKADIEDLKGYEEADPWGCNVSTGLRWEYLPAAGFAEATVSYLHDVVSPGYELGVPMVRLRDRYDTFSGHLAFENVLTRRLRTLVEFQVDDTTDREWRYTLTGTLNCAVAEHCVLRLAAAGVEERPCFESESYSAVLERDWHGTWFASVFARYYEDTGEIVNAVVRNASAPPLETYQVGFGLRWRGHRSSLKLVAGPCFTRYQPNCPCDPAFDQLYKDRDWLSVQFAFVHEY